LGEARSLKDDAAQRLHERLQKNRTHRSRMQRRPTELSNPRADLTGTFKRAFLACSTLLWIFITVVVAQAGLGFSAPGTLRRNSANTSNTIAVYKSSEQLQESLREKRRQSPFHGPFMVQQLFLRVPNRDFGSHPCCVVSSSC
jgi:hypothetical protein